MAWHPNFDNDENGSASREARMDAAIRLRLIIGGGLRFVAYAYVTIAAVALMFALGGAHF